MLPAVLLPETRVIPAEVITTFKPSVLAAASTLALIEALTDAGKAFTKSSNVAPAGYLISADSTSLTTASILAKTSATCAAE